MRKVIGVSFQQSIVRDAKFVSSLKELLREQIKMIRMIKMNKTFIAV